MRDFDLHAAAAREKIEIIAQGSLGESDRGALLQAARRALSTMEKITVMPEVADDSEFALYPTLTELRSKLASVVDEVMSKRPLWPACRPRKRLCTSISSP